MTGQREQPDLRRGEVYAIPMSHIYGASRPMRIRIESVGGHPRGDWVPVRGAELDTAGRVVENVYVLVLAAAIPAIVAGTAREGWPLPVGMTGLALRRREGFA